MPTLDELQRHIEAHPNDHAERWRLAKKLYAACEYRQALEHLRLLKRDWKRRQNVCRYLAATYYRLGRYDDGIAELEFAIREWPDETGLREQVARIYEIAGRREEAKSVWEGILMMNPKHPMAERALERLRRPPEETPEDDLKLLESDSGIDLTPVIICPSCGAQNSEEFERCWQCRGALAGRGDASPMSFEDARPPAYAQAARTVQGLLGVAAAAGAAYFTLRYLAPQLTSGPRGVAADTIGEALQYGLATPRAAAGITWLILWPMALAAAMRAVRLSLWPQGQPLGLGLTMAGLAYTALWMPPAFIPQALFAVAVLSLFMTAALFPLSPGKAIAAGVVHTALGMAAGLGGFVALSGIAPIDEYRLIVAAAGRSAAAAPEREMSGVSVFTINHEFASTGSDWLDGLIGTVEFDVDAEVTEPMLRVEFRDAATLLELADVTTPRVTIRARVKPDTPYKLVVAGKDGVAVTIRAKSALSIEETP